MKFTWKIREIITWCIII